MKVKGFDDTIEWYDQNAKQYADASYKIIANDAINKFTSLLPQAPKILDAGCGAGKDSKAFHNLGIDVIGVDISKGLLSEARLRNPDITFIEGDLLDLPFENGSFDGLWSHASLVHLENLIDVKKALSEFDRVLKTNGILFIYTKSQTGNQETAVVKDSLSNHERFFRYYTEQQLKDLLRDAHFSILKSEIEDDMHGRDEVKWIKLLARKK